MTAVTLPSNSYWGKRSGVTTPKYGMAFPGRRGATRGSENSGPSGKRAKRFYPLRAVSKGMGKHGLFKLQQRLKGKSK